MDVLEPLSLDVASYKGQLLGNPEYLSDPSLPVAATLPKKKILVLEKY